MDSRIGATAAQSRVDAVLFDFSGTLFRLEPNESWVPHFTDHDGTAFDIDTRTELMRRMTAPVGLNVDVDEADRHAWENRDLDPALHRSAYLNVLTTSGVPYEQSVALYSHLIDPMQWTPYQDVAATLALLIARNIRVAVVSNIAFDVRPAFSARGWADLVDEFVLSFEIGATKPDPRIFRLACDRLGVDPQHCLMVGDSDEADGGARAIGCAFALVEPTETAVRTHGLLDALAANSIT
ncbi:HAD-IA family hydrolase [Antrihabitans sp. YC3-6]|uniref:HAD-IA family hydrolase n=1 Tax=Antrihabitans stalagmiti TaxID=2799499 RepID=A0A934NPB3_9NOCA|nr:HAD-IA family hydrolase [Antrihabitans stalagmiti]MBJ8338938.1 HAD-IA family hydrolase [Antrihabitans stalagmiti]